MGDFLFVEDVDFFLLFVSFNNLAKVVVILDLEGIGFECKLMNFLILELDLLILEGDEFLELLHFV